MQVKRAIVMNRLILEGERLDDLQTNGLHIIQNPNLFCFSMDAVLLADFCSARNGSTIVDLGTGTGILPLLLSAHTERCVFHAFEIQKDMADMARRSILINRLEEHISIYPQSILEATHILGFGSVDYVVSNPPYGRKGAVILNPKEEKRLARHEGDNTLADFIQTASKLLKTRGRFALVFPAQRMLEAMDILRCYQLEPKRLRVVFPKPMRAPNLVLIESVKCGKPTLEIMAPLIVYSNDGEETEEIKQIYHRA